MIFRSLEMFPASRSFYRFSARLSQQLFISANCRHLEFVLNYKCMNVTQGWLKVIALNEKEEYLYQDSVQIRKMDEWNRCVLKLPAQEACFFRIEICAVGGDDWLELSSFLLDRIQILGDGKNIDWNESLPVLEDDAFECIGAWPESVLPFVENKRIIALAETVHDCLL